MSSAQRARRANLTHRAHEAIHPDRLLPPKARVSKAAPGELNPIDQGLWLGACRGVFGFLGHPSVEHAHAQVPPGPGVEGHEGIGAYDGEQRKQPAPEAQ